MVQTIESLLCSITERQKAVFFALDINLKNDLSSGTTRSRVKLNVAPHLRKYADECLDLFLKLGLLCKEENNNKQKVILRWTKKGKTLKSKVLKKGSRK